MLRIHITSAFFAKKGAETTLRLILEKRLENDLKLSV